MKESRNYANNYAKCRELSMPSDKARLNTRAMGRIYARGRNSAVPRKRPGVFTPAPEEEIRSNTVLAYIREKPRVFTLHWAKIHNKFRRMVAQGNKWEMSCKEELRN